MIYIYIYKISSKVFTDIYMCMQSKVYRAADTNPKFIFVRT